MLHRDRPGSSVAFPALDSLRAVAAIAVLATHAAFWAGAYAHPVYGTALSRLDVGVAVFFVLSGFVLSRPWIARHRAGLPPPSTTHYLWKRALRLVPVYVVTVVAAMTLLPGNRGAGVGQWVTTLLLANIYVDDHLPDGLTQMWSLSTEVAFYLVLPVLMWLGLSGARGRRGDRLGLLALAMAAPSVVGVRSGGPASGVAAMTKSAPAASQHRPGERPSSCTTAVTRPVASPRSSRERTSYDARRMPTANHTR